MRRAEQVETRFDAPVPGGGSDEGGAPERARGAEPEDARRRARVREATAAARDRLWRLRRDDGHWRGELEGDSILESELILTLAYLDRLDDPRVAKAANTLRRTQLEEGGWAAYPGGAADVSASTKAYFVLKLLGDDPRSEPMRRARDAVRRLGGLEACNSFTKIYLAIFGQVGWDECPAVPPELVLLPSWVPFNLYEMSSWTRAIVVPLSIVWALKPSREVPLRAAIPELRVGGGAAAGPLADHRFWAAFFRATDRGLKLIEALGLRPLRGAALRRAERWIVERLEASDGLGAIFPPIVNTILAFRALGRQADDPLLAGQVEELERLVIEEGDEVRVEPCFSPVWDTALALNALLESGVAGDDPRVLESARWLLDREVRRPGDWRRKSPEAGVGGWYFEYANEFYPDCDDTSQVLTVLARVRFPDPDEDVRRRAAIRRGAGWMLGMQCRNGGWASFDRDCDKEFLTYIPFADHNAMIDPATVDITARVLESLAALGHDDSFPPARRGIDFVLGEQEPDGSWYGRWGCNYLYGTWLALHGLRRIGRPAGEPWARRAAAWLRGAQNPDGGWGELPTSYDDPSLRGQGPSTAAQTAWALLGLLAVGDVGSDSVRRGIDYLLATQRADGGWVDEPWTGTGFPRVFYLRYHLYATYFPLLALGSWQRALRAAEADRERAA